jgi:hypothetical protein
VNRFEINQSLLEDTFQKFKDCGAGRQECQVLWLSPWASPQVITRVVHSHHSGHADGFQVNDEWLNAFLFELADTGHGVRVQVHTHPRQAFHSETDDTFPIIHTTEFLSLVVPNFGTGVPSLDGCFLAEISATGAWVAVEPESRLTIVHGCSIEPSSSCAMR